MSDTALSLTKQEKHGVDFRHRKLLNFTQQIYGRESPAQENMLSWPDTSPKQKFMTKILRGMTINATVGDDRPIT